MKATNRGAARRPGQLPREASTSQAYRGYLIRWRAESVTNRDDGYWIEVGGAFIGYARDLAHARALVDQLDPP